MKRHGIERTSPANEVLRVGRLEELVTVQLRRVDIFLSRAFAMATEREQLKDGVISSLALIVANPGISQNEISRQTAIQKSTIVSIVDTLERKGWAVRRRSTEDRRRHSLHATKAGEAHLNALIDAVKEIEQTMLSRIPNEDLVALRTILDKMFNACIGASPSEAEGKASRRTPRGDGYNAQA